MSQHNPLLPEFGELLRSLQAIRIAHLVITGHEPTDIGLEHACIGHFDCPVDPPISVPGGTITKIPYIVYPMQKACGTWLMNVDIGIGLVLTGDLDKLEVRRTLKEILDTNQMEQKVPHPKCGGKGCQGCHDTGAILWRGFFL